MHGIENLEPASVWLDFLRCFTRNCCVLENGLQTVARRMDADLSQCNLHRFSDSETGDNYHVAELCLPANDIFIECFRYDFLVVSILARIIVSESVYSIWWTGCAMASFTTRLFHSTVISGFWRHVSWWNHMRYSTTLPFSTLQHVIAEFCCTNVTSRMLLESTLISAGLVLIALHFIGVCKDGIRGLQIIIGLW